MKGVVVVGAGVGGLATAVKLARDGFEVKVYEKNSFVGGRCGQLVREGHVFDTGPTMYLFLPLFRQFFESIGEKLEDWVELLRAEPMYYVNFADGDRLVLTGDMEVMREQLEGVELGAGKKLDEFMKLSRANYKLALRKLLTVDYKHWWEYANLGNLMPMLANNSLWPHYGLVSRYFSSDKLRALFTFADSYLSLNPRSALGIFSLFTANELEGGNYLPVGGTVALVRALEKLAGRYGVEIVCGAEVEKVEKNGGEVVGVRLLGGEMVEADGVVINADLSYGYRELLGDVKMAGKLSGKRYSNSVLTYHWGVKGRCEDLAVHNLYLEEDYLGGFDQVLEQKKPPLRPHFYVQAPVRVDVGRAPEGEDTLTVMIPINRMYEDEEIDWEEYAKKARKSVINRLEASGLGGVKNVIKFEISFKPTDWEQMFNLTYGSVYGLDHNLMQLGYLRPSRQHAKYRNVFFVGSSTHPGSGLPTVLLSAEFTSKRVVEELG